MQVCTYLNAFLMVIPNMVMNSTMLTFLPKLLHFLPVVCTRLPRGKHSLVNTGVTNTLYSRLEIHSLIRHCHSHVLFGHFSKFDYSMIQTNQSNISLMKPNILKNLKNCRKCPSYFLRYQSNLRNYDIV